MKEFKFIKKNSNHWPTWPKYGEKERISINRVLSSNQISGAKEVEFFEKEFASYNNSKFAHCVGNATQGLHLALAALNIGVGDEVIVTNYSWISTASCILMQNAVPVFCDIEEDTLGINPDEIVKKISKKTKAIIIVHMFGYMCKIDKISKIAKQKKIHLIEDASHAHGSSYKKIKAGNYGDIGVFSLHQRKNLSSGEGGIVVCKSKKIAKKIYQLRSFGSRELSYNYRMTEFCAAIARVRLKNLKRDNKKRQNNAEFLSKIFKDFKGINFLKPKDKSECVYHKLVLKFQKKYFKINLKGFIRKMQNNGVLIKETYPPLNEHSHFNPVIRSSRGIPWKWKLVSRNNNFPLMLKNLKFPVSNKLIKTTLIELDINPQVTKKMLKNFHKLCLKFRK